MIVQGKRTLPEKDIWREIIATMYHVQSKQIKLLKDKQTFQWSDLGDSKTRIGQVPDNAGTNVGFFSEIYFSARTFLFF